MFNTSLTPPTVDQKTIDHYVAKGSRLRSNAWAEFFQAMFTSTKTVPVQIAPKGRATV
ncbi:MAG: hypothetical protein AAFP68_13135 [Pseudomonadota bacterium]